MELLTNFPTDFSDRPKNEADVYRLLRELSITAEYIEHPPAMTMELCREIEKVLKAPIAKNLVLCNRQQSEFYLLVMPGDKPFKTKDLSAQIESSRLSFASAEKMEELLSVEPGSASVFALLQDQGGRVRLLVDSDVLKEEYFGCHPCQNTATLRLRVSDLTEKILPAVGKEFKTVML